MSVTPHPTAIQVLVGLTSRALLPCPGLIKAADKSLCSQQGRPTWCPSEQPGALSNLQTLPCAGWVRGSPAGRAARPAGVLTHTAAGAVALPGVAGGTCVLGTQARQALALPSVWPGQP